MFRIFGSTFTRGLAATIVTTALSFAVTGCGSSDSMTTTPDAGPPAPCDLAAAEAVLTPKCALSGCHDTTTKYAGLDLSPAPDLGTRLLGVRSSGSNGSFCASNTTPYLEAHTNPATGLLLQKVSTTAPCGMIMPFGATPTSGRLSATAIACLTSWATTVTSP
jgi:hypothetical protein